MPANLTPEYKKADEEYRAAKDPREKHACLEKMLRTIPKHKGTEKMVADLRRRIAQSRESLEKQTKKKGFGVKVEREGAAQAVMVGAPNSGKSALVEATTNARVEVGDHPFSTRTPVPAILQYENLQFQLVDLPPVSREHLDFWVADIIRASDCALWVVDVSDRGFEGRIEEVTEVLAERKIRLVGPKEPRGDRQEALRRLPTWVIAAKIDEEAGGEILPRLRERLEEDFSVLPLSAMGDTDSAALGRCLFDMNRIVRVYSKTPGKDPDRSKPFILHEGDDLMDFAVQVHKDFGENLGFARVWGRAKYVGLRVPRDYRLVDGDVIELHAQ